MGITVEEYLKLQETATERLQYFNGEIFAMSGGTPNHAWIATNIIAALHPALRNTGCRIGNGDLAIWTPAGLYTYPDVVISCAPEKFNGNFLINPVVIVEVLSETTEGYDRGEKFEKYRGIESFQEYLLVAQDRVYVEHHVRGGTVQEPVWLMREFRSIEDTISIRATNAALPVSLVYADINLDRVND